jgi:hypothetical protein
MSFMTDKLPHDITWWSTSAGDGYGGDQFATPVLIKGRWEDRQEKYIGQLDRREAISQAIVFVDRDVAIGDYICLGNQVAQASPAVVTGAHKIQQFRRIPDLRNVETVRRAVL